MAKKTPQQRLTDTYNKHAAKIINLMEADILTKKAFLDPSVTKEERDYYEQIIKPAIEGSAATLIPAMLSNPEIRKHLQEKTGDSTIFYADLTNPTDFYCSIAFLQAAGELPEKKALEDKFMAHAPAGLKDKMAEMGIKNTLAAKNYSADVKSGKLKPVI